MKMIAVAFLAVLAVAAAVPVDSEKVVQIVRSEFDQSPEGGYNFNFEQDDGTNKEETGELKTLTDKDDKPVQVVVVRGSYSYVDSEGKPVTVTYYADETGFHAEGATIPKANL